MKFDYKKFSSGHVRPIIPIALSNRKTSQHVRCLALVDSGSDFCIFPADYAELIGIDVLSGTKELVGGVIAGERRPMYFHDVDLLVGGWRERARIAFMPELSKNGYGLLGRIGFFDRYSFVKFEHRKEIVELGAIVSPITPAQ